jgi:hypothetical protein
MQIAERMSATIQLGGFSRAYVPLGTQVVQSGICTDYYGSDEFDPLCHLTSSSNLFKNHEFGYLGQFTLETGLPKLSKKFITRQCR